MSQMVRDNLVDTLKSLSDGGVYVLRAAPGAGKTIFCQALAEESQGRRMIV